jgi:hypothetical protein
VTSTNQSQGDTWPNHRAPRGTPDLAKVGWVKNFVCLRRIRTPDLWVGQRTNNNGLANKVATSGSLLKQVVQYCFKVVLCVEFWDKPQSAGASHATRGARPGAVEDKVLSARPHGTPCDQGPRRKGANTHFFPMWVFNLKFGFFNDFFDFMVFWPYLGGYWPKLSATRGGLLGFEPSTSWIYKPSHCGVLRRQQVAWRKLKKNLQRPSCLVQ